ncbi:hypothetical protein QQX09_04850 [Demequina sp. SYSU T00192]|uniref:Uncharacterized protein n=1 Tax=Demequina litoralis TaxID=3051660 RepID=A0ABT8G7R2_9MICO|nr:hypothetical protein [Demequina sp. SYSU T00192]MDN4475187.1 hypothetical protein [Demequina sp. SYSU T00192]
MSRSFAAYDRSVRMRLIAEILDACERMSREQTTEFLAYHGIYPPIEPMWSRIFKRYTGPDHEIDAWTKYAKGWPNYLEGVLLEMSAGRLATLAPDAQAAARDYEAQNGSRLPEDTRAHYERQVQELLTEISEDDDLSAEDKSHFVKLLEALLAALNKDPGRSTPSIRQAAEAVVSDAVLRRDLWTRSAPKPWAKKTAAVVTSLLVVLGAVGGYNDAKELVADVWRWLPALTATPQETPEPNGDATSPSPYADDDHPRAAD